MRSFHALGQCAACGTAVEPEDDCTDDVQSKPGGLTLGGTAPGMRAVEGAPVCRQPTFQRLVVPRQEALVDRDCELRGERVGAISAAGRRTL